MQTFTDSDTGETTNLDGAPAYVPDGTPIWVHLSPNGDEPGTFVQFMGGDSNIYDLTLSPDGSWQETETRFDSGPIDITPDGHGGFLFVERVVDETGSPDDGSDGSSDGGGEVAPTEPDAAEPDLTAALPSLPTAPDQSGELAAALMALNAADHLHQADFGLLN